MSEAPAGSASIVRLAKDNWNTPLGLVLAVVVGLGFGSGILRLLRVSLGPSVCVLGIVCLGILIVWDRQRKPPRTKGRRIGFAVAIACSTAEEHRRVREDFVVLLRQLIKGGRTGTSFQFLEIPQHLARAIGDVDDAQGLRLQCRAHFLLYGRVRDRTLGGLDFHLMDLHGIVSHSPIPQSIQRRFSREFRQLLPVRVNIAASEDVLGFEITTQIAGCVARYIIGMAATFTGDDRYAESLYRDVLDGLPSNHQGFFVYDALSKRTPERLADIYEARAAAALKAWTESRNDEDLSVAQQHLDKIAPAARERYSIWLLDSILTFLRHHDPRRAIEILQRCRSEDDATWRLNLAFLYGYQGDLGEASREYRAAARMPMRPSVIADVEEFLLWAAELEPERIGLRYCLGELNWKIKGDLKRAQEEFLLFLSGGVTVAFDDAAARVNGWLREIRAEQDRRAGTS